MPANIRDRGQQPVDIKPGEKDPMKDEQRTSGQASVDEECGYMCSYCIKQGMCNRSTSSWR